MREGGERRDETPTGEVPDDRPAPPDDAALAGEQDESLLSRRRWSFVAGGCLIAAAVLWPLAGVDAAFVAAVLGAVAWFLDQRARLRLLIPAEADAGGDDYEDEYYDEGENLEGDEEFDGGKDSRGDDPGGARRRGGGDGR